MAKSDGPGSSPRLNGSEDGAQVREGGEAAVADGEGAGVADASRPVRRRLSGGCRDAGELSLLDGFDAIILDDIGYVQQSRAEMEVLFTLLAERYERRSVIITSNLGLRSVSAR